MIVVFKQHNNKFVSFFHDAPDPRQLSLGESAKIGAWRGLLVFFYESSSHFLESVLIHGVVFAGVFHHEIFRLLLFYNGEVS